MSRKRLEALSTEVAGIKTAIATINDRATAEGREVSDDEQADIDKLFDRAEQIKPELEKLQQQYGTIEAVDNIISRLGGQVDRGRTTPAKREPAKLSVGEYLSLTAQVLNGDIDDAEYLDRAGAYHDRATDVVADVVGIIPEPIIGPLIDIYDSRRRVWASFTHRTMPSKGKTFERPYVTQHVAVGEQLTEGTALTSQKFEIDSDTVTKRTFGGTLELSRQVQDWTDPSLLGLVVNDFVKVYARFTEAAAVAHLLGLATATSAYANSTVADVVGSYVNACEVVCAALDDDVPLTIWQSVDAAVALTVPTGANERPLWSVVKEALGALDSEINWVTSRRLPAGTRIVGAGELVEAYEQLHGLLSMVKPTNLATDLAYSGYAAFYGVDDGFVHIGTPAS